MTVAEESHTDDRIWRTIDQHRARALQRLDGIAANALNGQFRVRRRRLSDSEYNLAHMIARDLTALGMVVHDSSTSLSTGGVWLTPCPEYRGVIVAWTQHEASAAVLGRRLHCELQLKTNSDLGEALRMLGYTVKVYGSGRAHVVTTPRPIKTAAPPPPR